MPFFDNNDVSIYYEDIGQGKPVILLHELGGNIHSWKYVRQNFSERHRVIMPDFRGAGMSEKPRIPFDLPELVEDVVALVDHLELNRPSFIGSALGAVVSLTIEMQRPDLVGSLVLCSVAHEMSPETKRYADERARLVEVHGMRAASELSASNSFPIGITRPVEQARSEYIGHFLSNDPVGYAMLTDALMAWNAPAAFATVNTRTLCVAGQLDHIWGPKTVKFVADQLPNAQFLVLPQGGHFPHLSSPIEFGEIVQNFLNATA
jgi:3-oxoadipate enol-lactonase